MPEIAAKEIHGVKDRRKYQRYAINFGEDASSQFEVKIDGEPVRLAEFSLGGLRVLSETPFSPGTVSVSVDFENRGSISLYGKVDRIRQEGDVWEIAIDLSEIYELDALRKA